MRTRVTAIILSLALLVGACGSSPPHKIDDEEFDASFAGKSFSNLLVMGVYQDRTFRISSETAFAEELKSRGINASPSYDLLPNTRAGAAEIQSALTAGSFDGVITVATLDPGYDYDAGDYFATRGMVRMLGGEPGAGTDIGALIAWSGSGLYTLYVGLWDAETGKPVWGVTTDSETTGSESGDIRTLAEFVADELNRKGLL